MSTLLGDRFVPESLQSRRRSMRRRLRDVREPVRSRREDMVPGPDLIGTAERQVSDLRNSFVNRGSVVGSLREMMDGVNGNEEEQEEENGEEQNGENNMTSDSSRGRVGDEVRA